MGTLWLGGGGGGADIMLTVPVGCGCYIEYGVGCCTIPRTFKNEDIGEDGGDGGVVASFSSSLSVSSCALLLCDTDGINVEVFRCILWD